MARWFIGREANAAAVGFAIAPLRRGPELVLRASLEGNASGYIVRCDRPREIALTWEFGESSDVRVSLIPDGEETVLELEHSPVPVDVVRTVGETWGLGAGWELAWSPCTTFWPGACRTTAPSTAWRARTPTSSRRSASRPGGSAMRGAA
jgi:hypothetical protein